MNRFEMIRQTLMWESVANAARAKAAKLRDDLTADAQAEYAEQGTAPTWRLPDIGTVSLPVSTERVVVDDPDALMEWVRRHRPAEVQTLEQVRPTYVSWLVANAEPAGDVVCIPGTGEVVPGLAVKPGGQPQSLSFRPSSMAKQVAAAGAERLVEGLEASIGQPIVLAEPGESGE